MSWRCYSSMEGDSFPAAARGHSAGDEIIHRCIRFCVHSTRVCVCVSWGVSRLFTFYPGTFLLPEPSPDHLHPGYVWVRTKYQQDIWKQHHQQHWERLTNTDGWCEQSCACIFGKVWSRDTGGDHRVCVHLCSVGYISSWQSTTVLGFCCELYSYSTVFPLENK